MKERIQKIIANSGYCSRRVAEKLIGEGRVELNGITAEIGQVADSLVDKIYIDGNPLGKILERTYIMLNKPRGYITTMKDERGRKTVSELTADVGKRVYPVGRLDYNSEGLLIMTDDGDLANYLMHPSHEIPKTYLTRVRGDSIESSVDILKTPLEIDGYRIRPAIVKIIEIANNTALLSITITEGKNRQIRKMCEIANLEVLRLRRISEGKLSIGKLPSGEWRYLTREEISMIKDR